MKLLTITTIVFLSLPALAFSTVCEVTAWGLNDARQDVVISLEVTHDIDLKECTQLLKLTADKLKKCDVDFQGFITRVDLTFKHDERTSMTDMLILKECP